MWRQRGGVQRFRQRRDRVGAGRHAELWRCGAGCDQRRQLRADGVGLSSGNYAISYTAGSLAVSPAALTVAANNAGKIYDGLAYHGGNGVVFSGFVNGETASVLGGTLSYGGAAQGATNVGNYALTASGLSSGNYAISYTAGSLAVSPAALTVAATTPARSMTGWPIVAATGWCSAVSSTARPRRCWAAR